MDNLFTAFRAFFGSLFNRETAIRVRNALNNEAHTGLNHSRSAASTSTSSVHYSNPRKSNRHDAPQHKGNSATKTLDFDEWEDEKDLSSQQHEIEEERLKRALSDILKIPAVDEWLAMENPAFEGLSPRDVISRGQADRLWRMIYRREAGLKS